MATSKIVQDIPSCIGNVNAINACMTFSAMLPRNGHNYVMQVILDDEKKLSNKIVMYDVTDNWRTVWAIFDRMYCYGEHVSHGTTASFAGCLTGGGKNVRFSIPLPRILPNDAVLTLTSMNGSVRGVNGYIGNGNSNWLTGSGYTLTISKESDCIAEVNINFTEALSTTNNTPITYTGSLSFDIDAPSS